MVTDSPLSRMFSDESVCWWQNSSLSRVGNSLYILACWVCLAEDSAWCISSLQSKLEILYFLFEMCFMWKNTRSSSLDYYCRRLLPPWWSTLIQKQLCRQLSSCMMNPRHHKSQACHLTLLIHGVSSFVFCEGYHYLLKHGVGSFLLWFKAIVTWWSVR